MEIQHSHTMTQVIDFVKAFILINVVWTSDKIFLFISSFFGLSNLHNFLIEFQILVNIFVSISIGAFTIVKIYKLLKKKDDNDIKEEEKGEDEEA